MVNLSLARENLADDKKNTTYPIPENRISYIMWIAS